MLRSIFLVFLFAIFANAKLTRRDLISEAIAKGKDADKKFADAVPNAEPKLLEDAETAPKETPKNLSPLLPKQSDPFLLGRRPSYHHHQHHHHVANQGQKCCNQDKLEALIHSINKQSVLLRQILHNQEAILGTINVDIISEGCNDPKKHGGCGYAFIKVNGRERSPKKRGYNVVVLNKDGSFKEARSFDTHGRASQVYSLIRFIKSIHDNSIVLIAIQDESTLNVKNSWYRTRKLQAALKSVGCEDRHIKDYRHSWACAGHKGKENVSWVKHDQRKPGKGPTHISVKIVLPKRRV